MVTPKIIVIDTSILDESAYNLSGPKLVTFRELARTEKLKLLLPDPIEREVKRHLRERSATAVKSLIDAERRTPFVRKIKDWPLSEKTSEHVLEMRIHDAAQSEWTDFLRNFQVERLDYSTIDISEIMDWYDNAIAPFGETKGKKKEFPDAFAIAAVRDFAAKNKENVAVISKDGDWTAACHKFEQLFSFKSIAAYMGALLAKDEQVQTIQALMKAQEKLLADRIATEFPELTFTVEANWEGEVSDVEAEEAQFDELEVIGLGEHEFTAAFTATIPFSAHVSYGNLDTAIYDSEEQAAIPWEKTEGRVSEQADISGIVKCALDDKWTKIAEIQIVNFDDRHVTITEEPNEEDDYYYDD